MLAKQMEYVRFTSAQIVEHWVLFVSFSGLAITGLPQKFVGNGIAEAMIALMGGIETVRVIHHVCAVILVLASVYHVVVVAYKVFVLRIRWTMFPRLDDALDAIDAVRYNIGLTKEHPKLPRFNFAEKAEYWAMVWGTLIMALTGFIMWNPVYAARFVPGEIIPASKAAHGAEAILAVLAIFVWHFYNVHIKSLNKTVFTGKMTEHQMQEEHGLELENLKKGRLDPRPAPDVVKQRERTFIPGAVAAAVVLIVGVFLLATFENTAVNPDWAARRARSQVFAPRTPTPLPLGTPAQPVASAAKSLPASHEGRTTCMACHQSLTKPALPADHQGRGDTTCLACHKLGSSSTASSGTQAATPAPATSSSGGAKPLPAGHEGRTVCVGCHANLPQPAFPADHKGRDDATCIVCHKAGGSAPSTQATATPTNPVASSTGATATPAGSIISSGPKPLPASHAGRTTCNACHTSLPQPALPADHKGRDDSTCTACHKPQ